MSLVSIDGDLSSGTLLSAYSWGRPLVSPPGHSSAGSLVWCFCREGLQWAGSKGSDFETPEEPLESSVAISVAVIRRRWTVLYGKLGHRSAPPIQKRCMVLVIIPLPNFLAFSAKRSRRNGDRETNIWKSRSPRETTTQDDEESAKMGLYSTYQGKTS